MHELTDARQPYASPRGKHRRGARLGPARSDQAPRGRAPRQSGAGPPRGPGYAASRGERKAHRSSAVAGTPRHRATRARRGRESNRPPLATSCRPRASNATPTSGRVSEHTRLSLVQTSNPRRRKGGRSMARKTSRSPALRESGAQALVLGLDPVGRLHPRSHEGGQAGLCARSSSDGLVTFGPDRIYVAHRRPVGVHFDRLASRCSVGPSGCLEVYARSHEGGGS